MKRRLLSGAQLLRDRQCPCTLLLPERICGLPSLLLCPKYSVLRSRDHLNLMRGMKVPVDNLDTCLREDFVMVEREELKLGSPDGYLKEISKHIEDLSHDLRHISLAIHDDPELQYKEYHAHKVLTEYLQKQDGWKVTPSAYGIDTAFIAIFDGGRDGPVVSFNAEYDALAGIGHACGHNLIAIISLAAALATA